MQFLFAKVMKIADIFVYLRQKNIMIWKK